MSGPRIDESLSQTILLVLKNDDLHSPLVHVVLRVVQPHPSLHRIALPDEVEDVLHGVPGDQVSRDVFYDVMSCAALPRCAQHSAHSAPKLVSLEYSQLSAHNHVTSQAAGGASLFCLSLASRAMQL